MTEKDFQLISLFDPKGDQPKAIEALNQGLNDGLMHQTLLGVTGSGKTFTMAHVIQKQQRPTLIMAPNKTLAAQLYGEMRAFFPHNAVEYFVSYYDYYQPEAYVPASDTYIEKDASVNEHIEQMRLSATKALMERKDVIIVATVSAIYGLGDPKSYMSMMLHLNRGSMVDQRQILRRLTELQYTRNDLDLHRGTYRVQGDTIDVFPADSEKEAIRIELFGDEVENLSVFDPLTGKIERKCPRVTIYPKTHYVTPREKILAAVEQIKIDLKDRLRSLEADNKLVEAQRLEQRTQYDIEMLVELGYCSGIENYSRYLTGQLEGEPPPTLIDYFPKNALLILDESHVMIPQLGAMYKGDRARKMNLVDYGFRLPAALDNRPLKFEEFCEKTAQTLYVSATPGDYELERSGKPVEQIVRPTGLLDPMIEVRPAKNQVEDILSEIHRCVDQNERVLITTLTKRMAEDLTEYLSEQTIKVRYLHSDIATVERVEIIRDLRLGVFDVLVGINLLREGLDMPEVALVAIFDADKEGFLRSTRSLIQTVGRAARHLKGRAIMYADTITQSIQKTIEETQRRRVIQQHYNEAHEITPASIQKAVGDILEGAYFEKRKTQDKNNKLEKQTRALAKTIPVLAEIQAASKVATSWSSKKLAKHLNRWEKEMFRYAHHLEFERAAAIRDRLDEFKDQYFTNPI